MLNSVLGVALLTASSINFGATFKTQKQPQNTPIIEKKYANSTSESPQVQNYTLSLDFESYVGQQTTFASAEKSFYHGYNNYLNGAGYFYNVAPYRVRPEDNGNAGYIYIKNENTYVVGETDDAYTQSVFLIQITPYLYNIDNDIQIELNLDLDFHDVLTSEVFSSAKMRYDIITTLDDLSSYMDLTTYYDWSWINSFYTELQDANMGYQYSWITQYENIAVNLDQQDLSLTQEITIVPQRTNYVAIFFTPIGHTNQEENNRIRIASYDAGHYLDASEIYIHGTGIIPPASTEVVDIPGLMFEVLSMPWYFISTAFNLTLFAGTPYQINIANLFLAVIAMFVFMFIMKRLFSLI